MNKNRSSFHMGDEINGYGQQVYWIADEITPPPVSQANVRLKPNFNKYLPKLLYSISAINDPKCMNFAMLKLLGSLTDINQVVFLYGNDSQKNTLSFQLANSVPTDQSNLKIISKDVKEQDNSSKNGWEYYDLGKGDGFWIYYRDDQLVHDEWVEYNLKWYYLDFSGHMVTGWETIGGLKYYFKPDGSMVSGWKKIKDDWYFFDKDKGYMKKNRWILDANKWYYVDAVGHMVIGWKKIDGKWYYFNKDGEMATGSQIIMGEHCEFDSNGVNDGKATPMYKIYDFNFLIPEDPFSRVRLFNEELAEILMKEHQKYHELISEKQKEYVSQGAILACSKGTLLTKLDAKSATDISSVGSGRPILGCDACKTVENVHSFFSCQSTYTVGPKRDKMLDGYYKCIPLVSDEWNQDNNDTPIIWNNTKKTESYVLKKDAILICRYMGIIGIIDSGGEDETDSIEELAKKYGAFSYTTKEELLKADLVNLVARTIFGEQTNPNGQGQDAVAWLMANRVLAQNKGEFAGGKDSDLYNIVTQKKAFTALDKEQGNDNSYTAKSEGSLEYSGWVNAVRLAYELVDVFDLYYTVGVSLNTDEKDFIRTKLTERIGSSPIEHKCWYRAKYDWDANHTVVNGVHYYRGDEVYSSTKNFKGNVFFNYTYVDE